MTERDRAIASIRSSLAAFSVDTSDMTDEQVEAGVVALSRAVSEMGISTAECTRAVAVLNTALRSPWNMPKMLG